MRKIANYENKKKPCCDGGIKEPCKKCGEKKFHKIKNLTNK